MRVGIPLVVCFGGGVNSAAMLVGMASHGITPDLILFADTGGEKPATYAAVDSWSEWAQSKGMPLINKVKANSIDGTLEGSCLKLRVLPSIAYGFKTCSQRWKLEPQEKYTRAWMRAKGITQFTKAIGIDAGEPHRVKHYADDCSESWFPLVEWGWGRTECESAIRKEGLPVPVKSSCFFCPSMKKGEVLELKADHPDLFWRAVGMERNAKLDTIKGLGRHWSWEELNQADEAQFKMFPETVEMPCMCFDGEDS
jgi:hypothetical protein